MKYRMYFFVPYNISPIQQAIQAGHAALEYAHEFGTTKEYIDFIEHDKTWVILNGGTTNKGYETNEDGKLQLIGSLNQIHYDLCMAKINNHGFWETDLNDALTAVCFIADERVWDWENYPNFRNYLNNTPLDFQTYPFLKSKRIMSKSDFTEESLIETFPEEYNRWVGKIGGEKNVFLKNLIEGKKLA